MRSALLSIALLLGVFSSNSMAEVVAADRHGFSLVHEVTIDADRATAWTAAIGQVGRWWSSDHTITGDAGAMAIDAVPLGCFCEKIGADGGVVHLVVTFVNPGVMLRMTGGLGPLGLMGVDGNMTWEFFDAEDGTRVKFAYVVGGFYPEGLDTIAGAVDFVIGEALQRLKAYIETGDADNASVG